MVIIWVRSLIMMPDFRINRQEIINLTSQLIEKETINPPGNEYLTKEVITRSMKELGAKVKIFGKKRERPNILGEFGEGRPSLAIIAHMDVVPPGQGWKRHPFRPIVRQGRLYGRGAVDNKGPYSASWAAVKAIITSGVPFQGRIILGAVADEERGSGEGVKLLLKEGFKPDFCLIPDGGRINQAVIGEKGMLWITLESWGRQAHGSSPGKGINAIEKMARFMLHLRSVDLGRDYHPAFTKTTVNWAEIKGGEAPNIVPGSCQTTLDIRYPLGLTKKQIMERIGEEIAEFKRRDTRSDIRIKEILLETEPHLVRENSKVVKALVKAGKELDHQLTLKTIGGNSVAKELYFAGIPAISHSPEEGEISAHQANEFVKIDNLVKCARLWAAFLWEMVK